MASWYGHGDFNESGRSRSCGESHIGIQKPLEGKRFQMLRCRATTTESCSPYGGRGLKEDLMSCLESFKVLREIIHDFLFLLFKNHQ